MTKWKRNCLRGGHNYLSDIPFPDKYAGDFYLKHLYDLTKLNKQFKAACWRNNEKIFAKFYRISKLFLEILHTLTHTHTH